MASSTVGWLLRVGKRRRRASSTCDSMCDAAAVTAAAPRGTRRLQTRWPQLLLGEAEVPSPSASTAGGAARGVAEGADSALCLAFSSC